jgi:hypothetical protein
MITRTWNIGCLNQRVVVCVWILDRKSVVDKDPAPDGFKNETN